MKGYVVAIMSMPESVKIAERCVESGKQFNVDVEMFPAVFKDVAMDELAKEGLVVATTNSEGKTLPNYNHIESDRGAVIGNFVSQYRVWHKIVDSGESGIVLEHDAVFVDVVPDLTGKGDIINIGKPSYGGFKTKTESGVYPMFSKPGGYIPGAHGYYITVEGAKQLIAKAKSLGASPCDLYLNNKIFPDIMELWPQVVEARDSFTTIQKELGCRAKHNFRKEKSTYKFLK